MKGKLDRRQVRSRTAIREAFRELLVEKELSQITVTEIARRADRDRKTFYLHYGSIDELVDEMLQEECESVIELMDRVLTESAGGIDIRRLYDAMGATFIADINRRSNILAHVDASHLLTRIRPLLTKEIAKRDSLGLAHVLGPYLELFVAYFSAGILNLYNQWLTLDSELPIECLSELAMATVAGGVSALNKAAEEMQVNKK